ncbi:MAG: DoxX family protein [Pseudonocardiaceae bacterium]
MYEAPQAVREFFLLVARLAIGVVLLAHGWQKFFTYGMEAVTSMFTQAGIPLPGISAWFAASVELIGGAAFILGLLMPLVSILFVAVMAGAFVFVHAKAGLFAPAGYEYVLVLGTAALAVGFSGSKYSIDGMVRRRSKQAVSS